MAESQEYMTVDEAAVLSKVSSVTIRRAIKAATLRYRAQRGKTLLLAREDVEHWVRSRTEIRLLEE